jgi:hypothetical protein
VTGKSKGRRKEKASNPRRDGRAKPKGPVYYWLVLVVPSAGAAFVVAGSEVISPVSEQPTKRVETAAIKNNNFFIRCP